MKIYSNKKRPVKASNDGRKWVNTELTQDEYAKFRNFLKKKGYKYETSGAGDMVHIEAYLNEAEIKEADNFLDTLDDVNGACGKKSVKASTSDNIPYDLVSMLVALRDWVSIDDTDYINDEHRKLVDVADSLYNVGISVNEMSPEYQEVYNKYGKDFFDLVLDDVAALDSQLTSNNVNDLIADYNDREASYTGVNASTKRRRSAKAVNASETSVTATIDDGMHIIIDSKAYVDVTEDDFEQGEVGPYVNSWEFDVRGEYNSIGELVRAISENSYVFSEDVGDYYYMDGSIRTSATVDVDNSKPTDAQIDAWQRGEEKLYVADMYLDIKVGTVHEMTEDEARDFGISLY